jgi:hypothetical protein
MQASSSTLFVVLIVLVLATAHRQPCQGGCEKQASTAFHEAWVQHRNASEHRIANKIVLWAV